MKSIWLGVGFLNRTGEKIGHSLGEKCKKVIFYRLKNSKKALTWVALQMAEPVRIIVILAVPVAVAGARRLHVGIFKFNFIILTYLGVFGIF